MKLLNLTKTFIITLCLLLSKETLLAQSCTQELNTAAAEYQDGQLQFVEKKAFKDCFRVGGYTDPEKIAARKLMVQVYIYEDRIPEAEDAMIKLLHDNPEHPIDEALDPYEFVHLYGKFRTKPIFRVGIRVGVTYSSMTVIDEFGMEDLGDSLGSSFTPRTGLAFGTYIDYNFWKNFEVSLGVSFAQKSVLFNNDLFSQTGANPFYSTTTYTDTYGFIDVPLVVKYNFTLSPKIVIYPYAGIVGNYLLSASRSGVREVVNPPSVNLKKFGIREKLNYSYTAGFGVKFRSSTNYITVDIGASKGGNNFVDPDGRYQSGDLVYRLGQVDGNMSLDHLTIVLTRKIHSRQ